MSVFVLFLFGSSVQYLSHRCTAGRGTLIHSQHVTGPDNFIIQLMGEKDLFLVPPEDHKGVYYKKNYLDGVLSSFDLAAVDPDKPDYSMFPLFKNVNSARVRLTAGEVLYLPSGWGHKTFNRGSLSLMVNYWLTEAAGTLAELVRPSDLSARSMFLLPHEHVYDKHGQPLKSIDFHDQSEGEDTSKLK